jgi:hypothetical protein
MERGSTRIYGEGMRYSEERGKRLLESFRLRAGCQPTGSKGFDDLVDLLLPDIGKGKREEIQFH